MLKKKLIPTPLIIKKGLRIESGPPLKPVPRWRLLFIFWLILKVTWHQIMARAKGPNSEYTPLALAIMVRTAMERLGGLWIKVAQIIATRRDLFNHEFCDEVAKFHDRAFGFPGEEAKRIIEAELGFPVENVFREFDIVPIAAASIGQVHIAYLRHNGRKVAVKVQRPGIAESFSKDMAILAVYIDLLRFFKVMPWGRWDQMYTALEGTLADELDYQLEAAAMRRMHRTLELDKIHVPKVYTKYSKKRVLVMEFIDGVLMSDYLHAVTHTPKLAQKWCKENDVEPKKLGKKLFLSFRRQLLEDNMFHGDLHPGNIMILKKSKFCFIDYGSVGSLDAGFLGLLRVMRSAAALDVSLRFLIPEMNFFKLTREYMERKSARTRAS